MGATQHENGVEQYAIANTALVTGNAKMVKRRNATCGHPTFRIRPMGVISS